MAWALRVSIKGFHHPLLRVGWSQRQDRVAEGQHLRLDTEVIALALDRPSGAKHLHLCLFGQGFCWGQRGCCVWQQCYVHRGAGVVTKPGGGRGPSGTEGTVLSLPQLLLCPWQTSSLDTSLGASQGQFPWGWDPLPSGNAGLLGFLALLPKCGWQITNPSPRDERVGLKGKEPGA